MADVDGDASDGEDGEVEDNAAAAAADSDTEVEPPAKAAAKTSTAATSARSSVTDVPQRDSPQLTASMLLLKEAQAALEAARQADAATRAKAEAEAQASMLREQEEEVGDGEPLLGGTGRFLKTPATANHLVFYSTLSATMKEYGLFNNEPATLDFDDEYYETDLELECKPDRGM